MYRLIVPDVYKQNVKVHNDTPTTPEIMQERVLHGYTSITTKIFKNIEKSPICHLQKYVEVNGAYFEHFLK